jgi:hypothetical protein
MPQREGKPFFIYALVCPLTLEVKYVGQTNDLILRTRGTHGHGKNENYGPLTGWLRTLGYLSPYRVILEQGTNRRVAVTVDRAHIRGRKANSAWLSSCLEAKWAKRFRRTIVNRDKTVQMGAYQALVNPPLPWGNAEDAPIEQPIRHRKVKTP